MSQIAATILAQTGAILTTKRIFRKIRQNQFPDPGNQIDLAIITILLVFGIGGPSLLPVQKKSVLGDRPAGKERLKTPDALKKQGIGYPRMDSDFGALTPDRSFNFNGLPRHGKIRKGFGAQNKSKKLLRYPPEVRDTVNLKSQFTNG